MNHRLVGLMMLLTVAGAGEQQRNGESNDPTGEKAWLAHGFTESQRASLREAFRWGIENRFIPGGALLIAHRGEPVFREAFGVADLETGRPFTVDAPCRIASVTKPHTATLLAMLMAEGKLSWPKLRCWKIIPRILGAKSSMLGFELDLMCPNRM